EDGIRDFHVTGVQTCALPIFIGGGEIFAQALPLADRMYITFIDETFEGDTFFPHFSEENWKLTSKTKGERNEKNPYDYYFLQYEIGRASCRERVYITMVSL